MSVISGKLQDESCRGNDEVDKLSQAQRFHCGHSSLGYLGNLGSGALPSVLEEGWNLCEEKADVSKWL